MTSSTGVTIDGAMPKICWILGTVVTKFPFAIVLLCTVLLVANLTVHFIRFQWFPLILRLANGKQRRQVERLQSDRKKKSLSGIEKEEEIDSFSKHKLFSSIRQEN